MSLTRNILSISSIDGDVLSVTTWDLLQIRNGPVSERLRVGHGIVTVAK
jgi:hypothetical protein